MHKRSDLTVGLGDSDAEIGRRVRSFLREQGVEQIEITSPKARLVPARNQAAAKGGTSPWRIKGMKIRALGREVARGGIGADTPPAASASDRLHAAMARAQVRGETRIAEILAQPEMLSGEDFGKRIGITRQAVDKRRNAGELVGLEGPSRGVRYPAWQITPEGRMLPGLRDVLRLSGGEPWTAYRLLVEEFPDGSGARVHEKLRRGEVEPVLAHLEAVIAGAVT